MICNFWLFIVCAWITNFLRRLIVRLGLRLSILISFLTLLAHVKSSPEVQRWLTWLQAQVQSKGELSGEVASIAKPVKTHFEAALAFVELKGGVAVLEPLRAKLIFDGGEVTKYLARKIIAFKSIVSDTTELISQLSYRQNGDGGFGSSPRDSSTELDKRSTRSSSIIYACIALMDDSSIYGKTCCELSKHNLHTRGSAAPINQDALISEHHGQA